MAKKAKFPVSDEQRGHLGRQQLNSGATMNSQVDSSTPAPNSHGDRRVPDQKRSINRAKALAAEYGVSVATIFRNAEFAERIEVIQTAAPGAQDAILTGRVKHSRKHLAELVRLPEPQLKEAAKLVAAGEVASVKEAIAAVVTPEEPRDATGTVIPEHMRAGWAANQKLIEAAIRHLRLALDTIDKLRANRGDTNDESELADIDCRIGAQACRLRLAAPHAICDDCHGAGCKGCHGAGWLTEREYFGELSP